jgi:DNA-binding winged helix-turn-helix (wHTH) protein/pimeloyl-ACP methyl ester carboxylesterase
MLYGFEECELDLDAHELRRSGKVQAVKPRVFKLLGYLVENSSRMVSKDELLEHVWDGRIVSDSALSSQIKAARKVIGDDGKAQRLIRTIHGKGFRFVGGVKKLEPTHDDRAENQAVTRKPERLQQEVRFCTAQDGVRIAFAVVGSGKPLVKAANWMSHLDFELESPIWRHWISGLSASRQLIRYDERGNGMSDRDTDDLSFEAMVADLETVVDALELDRFPLFGISQGCAVSVEYAVRHPDRVSCLVLYGGFVKGWRKNNDPLQIGLREAMTILMKKGWGQDNPAFRQVFTTRFVPGASAEQMSWFNELQRITVSPETAARFHEVFGNIDVSDRLASVRQPTLVLHARNDGEISFGNGRAFATGIPGARFVTLDSHNHILLEEEPAFSKLMNEVNRFLDQFE